MTVRRDLDLLESEGLLRRVRGAAVGMLTGEESPFAARSWQRLDVKRRIGAEIASLIDDGSTTLETARHLLGRRLTVLPLSLHGTELLPGADSVRLVVPGGDVRPGELRPGLPDHRRRRARHRHRRPRLRGSPTASRSAWCDAATPPACQVASASTTSP